MIEKISRIEVQHMVPEPAVEHFIIQNKEELETIYSFNKEEFNNLNMGMSLDDILLEREIIKKFG